MLVNQLTVPRGDRRYLRYEQDVACLATDSIGDFVAIRGEPTNGKWRVQKANPGDIARMPAVGILVRKSTPTVGVIQVYGSVSGVFAGLVIGKTYCVDYSGIKIGPPSVIDEGYAFRQFIGVAISPTILFLGIDLSMIKRR